MDKQPNAPAYPYRPEQFPHSMSKTHAAAHRGKCGAAAAQLEAIVAEALEHGANETQANAARELFKLGLAALERAAGTA